MNLELFTIRADGTGRRRLTSNGAIDWGPRLSPDGKGLAFGRTTSDGAYITSEILVRDVTGKQRRVSGEATFCPEWSPDGRWISFEAPRAWGAFGPRLGPTDIWIVRPDGSELRRVVDGGADDGGANLRPGACDSVEWSPDGKSLLFLRSPDVTSDRVVENVVLQIESGRLRLLTRTVGAEDWRSQMSWSKGGKIAFTRPGGLFVINADGTSEQRIARATRGAYAPSWSPNGRRIVFWQADFNRRTATTTYRLMNIRSDGADKHRLANGTTAAPGSRPSWSPDGTEILYGQGPWIYRVRADGRTPTRAWIRGFNPDW